MGKQEASYCFSQVKSASLPDTEEAFLHVQAAQSPALLSSSPPFLWDPDPPSGLLVPVFTIQQHLYLCESELPPWTHDSISLHLRTCSSVSSASWSLTSCFLHMQMCGYQGTLASSCVTWMFPLLFVHIPDNWQYFFHGFGLSLVLP